MFVRWLLAVVMGMLIAGFLPLPAGDKDDTVARDMKLMQGNWILHSFATNGKQVPGEKLRNIKLTIKGNHYLVDFGKQKMELTFTIDPTKKPKAIDLVNVKDDKKTVTPGIYEVSADTLKLCRCTEQGQKRPTEFAATEGSGLAIAVYQRDKK